MGPGGVGKKNLFMLAVEEILKEKGVAYELIPLSQPAYTVADTLIYSNGLAKPEEACKTIIIRAKKSGQLRAILLRGVDKLDSSKVRRWLGEDFSIASAEDVKLSSGVEPGAVCPLLLTVPLFVDKKMLVLEQINIGSGEHLFGLELKLRDLLSVVQYEVADITKSV